MEYIAIYYGVLFYISITLFIMSVIFLFGNGNKNTKALFIEACVIEIVAMVFIVFSYIIFISIPNWLSVL